MSTVGLASETTDGQPSRYQSLIYPFIRNNLTFYHRHTPYNVLKRLMYLIYWQNMKILKRTGQKNIQITPDHGHPVARAGTDYPDQGNLMG